MAIDAAMPRWRRLGYAALSGAAGWLAAQIACLPLNLIIAVRDSEGVAKLFVQTLFYGLLVWGLWTFALVAAAWVLVVLPLVMTIRPCLLVRWRFAVPAVAVLAALSLGLTKPTLFLDRSAVTFIHRYALFIPYGLLAVSFTLVTAWLYILLSKRRLDRASSDEQAAS